jgi:formylglycine-generating enzyme required for sulfatase activity
MDTRFKVIFLIAVLVMCSLPIMGILKGPPLPVEVPDPPFSPSPKTSVSTNKNMKPSEETMVEIPAGEFILGSNHGGYNEKPQHVSMLDTYWIDQYEVTYQQYMTFVEATGHRLPGPPSRYARKLEALRGPNQPVTYVSWNDAAAYCEWKGKRLPTEKEWEKAVRGSDGRTWPWGEGRDGFPANFGGEADGYEVTAPVGTFPQDKSMYGVYDGAGNVMEWVDDWYVEDIYSKAVKPDSVRQQPVSTYKTMRGGGYTSQGVDLRITNRSFIVPDFRDETIGFRCARPKDEKEEAISNSELSSVIRENQNNRG